MLDPGTRIGGYTLVEHVGDEGTMADVYRAVDEAGRTVAMKLLRTASERGRREAALAPQLDHPDIVRTFDVIEWEGRRCLIQEWIEGQSLRTVLDSQRHLDLAETIKMGRAVASALAYAHARNILHRDIKPSNVLRTVAGRYKLVDFGAVGLLDPATSQTRAGEIAGTPLYMSPEQIAGGSQTAASDIYGLGLLLFECFHGTLPGGSSPDFMQLIFARVNAPIDVPPSPLKALLDHCLDRDPAMRPQSAAEVRDALSRIMSGPTEAAEPVPTSAVEPVSIPDVVAVEGSPRSEPASRSVGLGALTGILVGVGGLVLLWLLAPDPGDVWSWLRLGAGVVIVGVALLAARWVRQLASRSPEAERQAAGILAGASDRDALTRSMVIQVDHVVARLKGIDAKVLGLTMVMLIREAEEARNSADRVAALMQIVALMEKLMRRLSPWYVRHKEGIATGIAIVGSLVGVASAVSGFLG